MENQGIIAIYDVRGIQDYIFKTAEEKDAIGASAIVNDIIDDALRDAVKEMHLQDDADLDWCNDNGAIKCADIGKKIQVLYIGGGNAVLIYKCEDLDSSKELYQKINEHMAMYIIENTYSLQLVAAMEIITGNYAKDYSKLMDTLNKHKAEMTMSKPLGALPVMVTELQTGYPATAKATDSYTKDNGEPIGEETYLKRKKEREVRKPVEKQIKILDNYITKKGIDSTIAVVHIDGNNMGLRIQELMNGIEDYTEAVNKMRIISYNIRNSYSSVYSNMQKHFNEVSGQEEEFSEKENENFVLKILTAGDDITYICNGKIALSTLKYFINHISDSEKYTLTKGLKDERKDKDCFSACAGIAYMNSHFPFYIGYEVAEACCENAKDYAKSVSENNKVGNWIDFQICNNIQAKNLTEMRKREYITSHGEQLLRRPYCIYTGRDCSVKAGDSQNFESLVKNIRFFQSGDGGNDGKTIPRSFAKQLRNTYPEGEERTRQFLSFLESRGWKMPDGTYEPYERYENGDKVAKWYDSLEMLDYFVDPDWGKEAEHEEISIEDKIDE